MSAGRKYLTKREHDALLLNQGGLCASWGCTSTGPFHADHHIPNAWEPGKPSQLLCIPCHRAKTRLDVKNIAKVKRLQKGPKKSKRPMRSRGFDKTKSKRMDGTVTPRSTRS